MLFGRYLPLQTLRTSTPAAAAAQPVVASEERSLQLLRDRLLLLWCSLCRLRSWSQWFYTDVATLPPYKFADSLPYKSTVGLPSN
eukprot:COSAG02_NODE_567_length_20212_cov_18.927460_18_plen_85_part_00